MNAGIAEEFALLVLHDQAESVRGARHLTVYGTIPVAMMWSVIGASLEVGILVYEKCIDLVMIRARNRPRTVCSSLSARMWLERHSAVPVRSRDMNMVPSDHRSRTES